MASRYLDEPVVAAADEVLPVGGDIHGVDGAAG